MGIAVLSAILLQPTFVIASFPPDRMAAEEVDSASDCKCLPWDFVYDAGAVRCGQGQELFSWVRTSGLSWEQVLPFAQWEVCSEFFEKFRHDACVNVDAGARSAEWHGAQWCYVSASCGDLNGGSRVPSASVSWKVCHQRRDTLLRSFKPSELAILAAEQELDLGFLAKVAYPLQAELWREVEHLWWPSFAQGPHLEALGFATQQVVRRAEPVIYEVQANSRESLVVVVGDSVWAMSFNGEIYSQGSYSLTCIVGCHEMRHFPAMLDKSQLAEAGALETSDVVSIDNAIAIASTSGECKCLNWKQAYASGRATCGQGLELSTPMETLGLSREQLPFVVQHEVCADFFAVQDHQMCIHVDAGPAADESNTTSWCYVPATCDGLATSEHVRWKMCAAGDAAISWNYASSASSSPSLQSDSDIRGLGLDSVFEKSFAWPDGPPDAKLRGSRRGLAVAAEATRAIQSHPTKELEEVFSSERSDTPGLIGQPPATEEPRRWVSLRPGFLPGTALGRFVVWMISFLPWIVGFWVLAVKASQVARWMWSRALDDLSSASPAVFMLQMKEVCFCGPATRSELSQHGASASLAELAQQMKEGLATRLRTGWPAFFCLPWRTELPQQSAHSSTKTAQVDWDRLVRLHVETSSVRK